MGSVQHYFFQRLCVDEAELATIPNAESGRDGILIHFDDHPSARGGRIRNQHAAQMVGAAGFEPAIRLL
jgi:hypothetical protein